MLCGLCYNSFGNVLVNNKEKDLIILYDKAL